MPPADPTPPPPHRPLGQTTREHWPDPANGPWRLTFHWALLAGEITCVGLDLRSFLEPQQDKGKPWRGVSDAGPQRFDTGVLRSLPLAQLVAEAQAEHKQLVEWAKAFHEDAAVRALAREQAPLWEAKKRRRRGRPAYGREHFEEVAAVYSAASIEGQRPTKAVQEHFGVAKSTAAKWVARARSMGLLRKAPGRGVPSPVPPPDEEKA